MFQTDVRKLIDKIKGSIVLPDSSYFIRNNNSISMCYYVYDRPDKPMYINLHTKQIAAQYLLDNGIVDDVKQDGDDVLLFRKSFYYTYDKGRPVMVQNYVPVMWDEITLTKKEVQQFAALDVWSRVSKGLSSYGNTVYNAPIFKKRYDA